MSSAKPREIAIQLLAPETAPDTFIEDRLDQALSMNTLIDPDRRLVHEMVYGVYRWFPTLDWLIRRKTEVPPRSPLLNNILRLGVYELFWLDRVPAYATVNEMVELAKLHGFENQAGFINALLRGYEREREATIALIKDLKNQQPALGHGHPEWLFTRWEKQFGRQNAIKLMEWNNTPAPVYARNNTIKIDPVTLSARWKLEGVQFTPTEWDWTDENTVFKLESHPPLGGMLSFKEGWFYVQDPSTLLAPTLLSPRSADTVLDMCAAPGGKTTFMAQMMGNKGQLRAEDIQQERINSLKENCNRLGVTCVNITTPPTLNPTMKLIPQYEKILVDAPCSNTGVMRRRVELRSRLKETEPERMQKIQIEILEAAERRLKPGGTLVYSTCSLEPEENRLVTQSFLAAHSQCYLDKEWQLLPFEDGVDGAYAARIKKTLR